MQTYSHFIITASLARHLARRGVRVDARALLAGSALPDAPLGALSAGYVLDRRILRPHLPDKTLCSPTYNDLYFNDPWWIAAHNLLHAPLLILLLGVTGFRFRNGIWGRQLAWFAAGCGLHSLVDIFTHAGDGPVLLFPLEWHKRINSPVSYWDPEHGGRRFRRIERLVDVALAGYLLFDGRRSGAVGRNNS